MMHWQIWEVSKILENVRISEYGLLCQNIHATQSPTSLESQKIPNGRERRKIKVLRQLFSMENL